MSKHILLYTDEPGLAGVGQYNHSILCALINQNYQVSCVQSQASNPMLTVQKELGIQHIWLDYNPLQDFWRSLLNSSDAREIFLQAKPDLIIFSDGCPLASFAAKKAAIELGIPYMIVLHLIVTPEASVPSVHPYIKMLSFLYEEARQIITVSSHNLTSLHKFFGLSLNKGKVIYLGRSQKYFASKNLLVRNRIRHENNIPEDSILCFTAARFELVKGYQHQLEAIRQLKQNSVWSKVYFAWAGSGEKEVAVREAVHQLEVADKVKVLGQRWDILDWLDASDIFILPSHLEGMPLSIIEAMAKGLPVIASAVNGIPEELGETGKLLTDPNVNHQATVREIVNTLQNWTAKPELLTSLGEVCRKRAEKLFREERMIQETLEVIESVFLLEEYKFVNLNLRKINLIVFPDWFQSETLISELASLLRQIAIHPDKNQITLLIDTSNIAEEDVDMMLSGVTMHLLMEENLELDEGTSISLIGKLCLSQWQYLLPRLHYRIILENENQKAITQVIEQIPTCLLESIQANIQLEH